MANNETPMLPPDVGMGGATDMGAMPPPVEPLAPAGGGDMVKIELPRSQLRVVIQAFKEITSMLEAADAQSEAEMPPAEEVAPPPVDINSPEALAAEIEGMRA